MVEILLEINRYCQNDNPFYYTRVKLLRHGIPVKLEQLWRGTNISPLIYKTGADRIILSCSLIQREKEVGLL
jgi:hypothetical protein